MNSFFIDNLYSKDDFGFFALIDPDLKNDYILDKIISTINDNNFSGVLVGRLPVFTSGCKAVIPRCNQLSQTLLTRLL